MTTEPTIALTTNIAALSGVGPKRAGALRRLGVRCVADLIVHLPHRYEHELGERAIAEAQVLVGAEHGSAAALSIRGEVLNTRSVSAGRRPRFEATLFDGSGTVLLTWFNQPWMRTRLHPGMIIRAQGKARRHGDYLQLINPRWDLANDSEDADVDAQDPDSPSIDFRDPSLERLRPVYPASEEITSREIERIIHEVLDPALDQIDDHLPESFRAERSLPELRDAYRMVHRPQSEDAWALGRRRLAYDELLLLQLGVMMKRSNRRATMRAIALKRTVAIDQRIRARIPFQFTDDQNTVVEEIVADLARDAPMNRLLQGDVGAGKTVVALYAMLLAVAAGHQAALMAPTELLAEQHFLTITALLADSRVRIELITGSRRAADRAEIDTRLGEGEIDIAIGTHALISNTSRFKSLAVAVVDEQHRFGVAQRAALRDKAVESALIPHTLIMTATPIPRTMAMTIFGDLDISTIRSLPPGRMPITTRIMPPARADEVYRHVAQRIERSEQAYIVVPVIDESDFGLKDVNTHYDHLRNGPLRGRRLAMMHGRMSRDERHAIMTRFRAGEIDALIATTVIEVGVDVPNASMMVIEHGERFGLAQLHQLRGRIGRGDRRSLCVLIADPQTDEAKARIEVIRATTDGFMIAEKDLEIRGPGEMLGIRQAGAAPFRIAELPRDMRLLEAARKDAEMWITRSPHLDRPEETRLRKRMLKQHGEMLGLADVA